MSTHKSEHMPSTHELTEEDLSNVTGGAVDAFLKLDGIKGESTQDKHKDWIEIF